MKKVGLFFGTFNPIHIGHLIIANHFVEFAQLDEVWLVISPQNPFKTKQSLLADHHRSQMVEEALTHYPKLRGSKIEFDMPRPNYTIDTLVRLEEKYPEGHEFSLIMGEDNLKSFHKWKNFERILELHSLLVYPRLSPGKVVARFVDHPKIQRVEAPVVEISSSFIRKAHGAGKNIRPLLPPEVWTYMDRMNFYRG